MSNTLSPPPKTEHRIKKIGILFAGGPAPAANAVISACSAAFLKNGIEVVGLRNGYSNLVEFDPEKPLEVNKDYFEVTHRFLSRSRNTQGIMIGTARANPGKKIQHPDDLTDSEKRQPLLNVYNALVSLGVEALVSIGGDDTLKTANKFKLFQETLGPDAQRIPVVHLPKTIDNDYHGIDFTFGYFTAVEFLGTEVRNLIYDAQSTNSYFVAETMGRSAGWLAYGAAIAGEASLVISVEDVNGDYQGEETYIDPSTGESRTRKIMNMVAICERIVKTMLAREKDNKEFGVIVIAEGLAEFLPHEYLDGVSRDDHGHIQISEIDLCGIFEKQIIAAYERETGNKRRVKGVKLGYESRCAKPHAFDVMLGSQLGVGAYRALVEQNHNGVMVSIKGQLELHSEPFENLVDPKTLVTRVRYIEPGHDFHRLARFLETDINE